jgi:hypothetical protein
VRSSDFVRLAAAYPFLAGLQASIYIQTRGVRTGPSEVLSNLGKDTSIRADQYSMRLQVTMETGDERVSTATHFFSSFIQLLKKRCRIVFLARNSTCG